MRIAQALLNFIRHARAIALSGSSDKGRLHPVIPGALANTVLCASVPPKKDLIDAVTVRFNLTLEVQRERTAPPIPLFTKERLKFNGRGSTGVLKKFQARYTPVTIEDDEFVLLGRDERELIDLASINDVFREVSHVLLALVEEPSYSGGFVFEFAVPIIRAIDLK